MMRMWSGDICSCCCWTALPCHGWVVLNYVLHWSLTCFGLIRFEYEEHRARVAPPCACIRLPEQFQVLSYRTSIHSNPIVGSRVQFQIPQPSYTREILADWRARQMGWQFGTKIQFALLALMTAQPSCSLAVLSLFVKFRPNELDFFKFI